MADLELARLTGELDARLAAADADLARHYPGQRPGRQPVHTVYVPADRFAADTVTSYGAVALDLLDEHEALFLELIGGDRDLLARVRMRMADRPVEDVRIDFEDGYGSRPDDEEDAAVVAAADALRTSIGDGSAPASYGIRFKSLERPTRHRGLRTLATFVERLTDGGPLPPGFVVTLPKVTSVDQVGAMVHAAGHLETVLGLEPGSLRFEIQVETPQSILGPDGTTLVARMVHAADGRCTGLHYGTYDYSAFVGIAGPYQSLDHPAADHAKAVMQAAAAGTGVWLSDGSTNILPVGDAAGVRRGWETHLRLVRRSLERGFYQGWDLHPAQLPTRYAATFAFYRERLDRSSVLEEPATDRALTDFIRRGRECGALDPADPGEA
ncbi:MAG TPA: aldolase [Nocardioides sp.]|nr:aldolase [Nocardioides sp.]